MKEKGKGSMPHPEAPPDHNVSCCKRLTKVFEALWQQVPQQDPAAHNMLVLLCEAGRHWSYALLIAFLMWISHIHEPQFWEAIISPIRNALLKNYGPCEVIALEDLKDYAVYLNAEFRVHAWPKRELIQL